MRESPLVLILFDSHIQPARGHINCTDAIRSAESIRALHILGVGHKLVFAGIPDDTPSPYNAVLAKLQSIALTQTFEEVYYPAFEKDGHDHHNAVAMAVEAVFPVRTPYLTYTRTHGKSRSNKPVPYTADMIARKHEALACYKSQMDPATGCDSWFLGDLYEYYA